MATDGNLIRDHHSARLSEALGQVGARVEERPISVLGTRALTEKVYCAKDPVAALHDASNGAAFL